MWVGVGEGMEGWGWWGGVGVVVGLGGVRLGFVSVIRGVLGRILGLELV